MTQSHVFDVYIYIKIRVPYKKLQVMWSQTNANISRLPLQKFLRSRDESQPCRRWFCRNSAAIDNPMLPPRELMLAAASWFRPRRRRSRFVLLILCSPFLIPFLCAAFPFLCAVELCLRICGKRRSPSDTCDEDARLRACEEGCSCGGGEGEGSEVGLLQRYLEDQLRLVGSVYECGDECDVEDNSVFDDGFVEPCRVPLLVWRITL